MQRLKKETKENLAAYGALMLMATIGLVYGHAIKTEGSYLRVWDVQNLLLLLLGIPFLFVQAKAGLPDFLDNNSTGKQRFLIPALLGAGFGLLDVLVIKVLQHPQPYTELPPFLQPFPYSLFLYTSGAFEIEVFYRLIPLTLILLLGKWFAKGKYFRAFFWAAIVLTSLREPLEQLPDDGMLFILYSLLTGFLMNFLQAWVYTRSGFLASLTLRLGHYLLWHILLGIYVQYFELQ